MAKHRITKMVVTVVLFIGLFLTGPVNAYGGTVQAGTTRHSTGIAGREVIPETSDAEWLEHAGMTAYDFRDTRNYGIACIMDKSEQSIDFEGLFGIRLDTSGKTPVYSLYNHVSSGFADTAKVALYKITDGEQELVKSLGSAKTDTEKNLTAKLSNGLYAVTATFTYKKTRKISVSGYLYVDDKSVSTCRVSKSGRWGFDSKINAWNYLLSDADPEDYLLNDDITYPTSGTNGNCVHVSEWEEISDELVLNDDWTDEAKVFAFVDYLSKNIAYDNYRYKQPNHKSRAGIAGDYKSDKYFTLVNNVGVCWDYTNILAIMCRHHGIPCTSVETAYHTYNAVWLNGGWVGIDITNTRRYTCSTEDTGKENWKTASYSYRNYGGYDSNMKTHDQNIWTKELGLGLK